MAIYKHDLQWGKLLQMSIGLLIGILIVGPTCGLEFGHNLGSHMVLQRAPERAILHGYADVIGDTVTISKNGNQVGTTQVKHSSVSGTVGYWEFLLPAESHPGPFTLTASCKDGIKTLTDVLYGDVWVCSGQSNMFFQMRQVYNSTEEINNAMTYTDIRFMASKTVQSNTSVAEADVLIPWTKPLKGSIDQFSAVCFMFGRNLRDHLKVPIGLIESSWGGTKIEVWSSPDAMAACPGSSTRKRKSPNQSSVLWNAMINPILKTTIKGALWYQGEANRPDGYDCRFQAMIQDWRQKFNTETLGQTNSSFPFGFVQLSTSRNNTNSIGFAGTRWAQTGNYGYVPNPKMPNTFMAVALDLPDFTSPYGAIHPRDKQDVADRLTLGARAVAYGESNVIYQGPFPTDYRLDTQHHTLDIVYDHNHAHLMFHNTSGFEICCDTTTASPCEGWKWKPTTMVSHTPSSVTIKTDVCSQSRHAVAGIRYLWHLSPCAFKTCPVYRVINSLPAPPFVKLGGFPTDGPVIVG